MQLHWQLLYRWAMCLNFKTNGNGMKQLQMQTISNVCVNSSKISWTAVSSYGNITCFDCWSTERVRIFSINWTAWIGIFVQTLRPLISISEYDILIVHHAIRSCLQIHQRSLKNFRIYAKMAVLFTFAAVIFWFLWLCESYTMNSKSICVWHYSLFSLNLYEKNWVDCIRYAIWNAKRFYQCAKNVW